MKQNSTRRGFTLIELLVVVVIIIGILAAIALPQYQKAIRKGRFASLKPIAKAVRDAQEIYYNRNGHYASLEQLGDLDIGVPAEANLDVSADLDYAYVRANHSLLNNSYTLYLDHSQNFAGNIYCEALTEDTNAEELCTAEGGVAGPVNGEYTLYLLSGNSEGSFPSTATPATLVTSFYTDLGTCMTQGNSDSTCISNLFSQLLTDKEAAGIEDWNYEISGGLFGYSMLVRPHSSSSEYFSIPLTFNGEYTQQTDAYCYGGVAFCSSFCYGSSTCSRPLDLWEAFMNGNQTEGDPNPRPAGGREPGAAEN